MWARILPRVSGSSSIFCSLINLFRAALNLSCISNITHLCPLCRIPFDKDSVIKLHVDLDAIPIEQASGCTSADLQEAQRLQKAIANIADKGTTEQNLRQLIQEGRTFLHGQPRNLVSVLLESWQRVSSLTLFANA